MVASVQHETIEFHDALLEALPGARTWRRVLLVVQGDPDEPACSLALRLARRDGASLILYDTTADSFWASPFPPGEGVRSLPLAEADLRRVGRDGLADTLHSLKARGVEVVAHVSTQRHGEDLAEIAMREQVDLVICPLPLDPKSWHHVHRSRQGGASLLECCPGEPPVFHAPLAAGEDVPSGERVQVRFLGALVLAFFIAVFRNRADS